MSDEESILSENLLHPLQDICKSAFFYPLIGHVLYYCTNLLNLRHKVFLVNDRVVDISHDAASALAKYLKKKSATREQSVFLVEKELCRNQSISVRGIQKRIDYACAAAFGVTAGRDERHRGIWVGDNKIGSTGIRVRHGVNSHCLAFNATLDFEHFS